jgi:hypothetical protein
LAIGGYRNDGNGTNAGHVRVYTDTSLGVDEAENIHQFAIYPNPSNGLLHLSGITEETRIQIYSLKGEKLFEQTASNNIEINVKLNSGLYLVRFNLFNNSLTKKLIIN